jgi:HPt (histidine-containing phosphotransfer) domain-containing protein
MKSNSSNRMVDQAALLDRCMGEVDFALELLSLFLDQAPPMMEAINESVAACDAERLRRSVHSLRGIALNVAAGALADELQAIESAVESAVESSHADLRRLRDVYFDTLGAVWAVSQSMDEPPTQPVNPT